MARTFLNVPYEEKDEAKALGAKWDIESKRWYISHTANSSLFDRWLTKYNGIIIAPIYLIQSLEPCWNCGEISRVHALLSERHKEKDFSDETGEPYYVNYGGIFTFFHIQSLDEELLAALKDITPHLYFDFSKKMNKSLLINHCEHCNSKLGDFYMFNEPGGAFYGDSVERWDISILIESGQYNYHGNACCSTGYDGIDLSQANICSHSQEIVTPINFQKEAKSAPQTLNDINTDILILENDSLDNNTLKLRFNTGVSVARMSINNSIIKLAHIDAVYETLGIIQEHIIPTEQVDYDINTNRSDSLYTIVEITNKENEHVKNNITKLNSIYMNSLCYHLKQLGYLIEFTAYSVEIRRNI
jgi:hypothetical protein